jgi:ribosomal protein S18 acetylase RimI-like enzyme
MSAFEIRSLVTSDLSRLIALDHSISSDYVWQLELRREPNQVTASFREVRLPRSVEVKYPRDPSSLADTWKQHDAILVAVRSDGPVGYICLTEDSTSRLARITDLVVAPEWRRRGAGSMLLMAGQTWAVERKARQLVMEVISKNEAGIRLAQKFGFEFCGYNDQYYPTQDVALFFGRALK